MIALGLIKLNYVHFNIGLNDAQYQGAISLLVGGGFFITGGAFLLKRINLLKNGIRTIGTLMELVPEKYTRGNPVFYPVVSFNTETNEKILKQYDIGSSYANSNIGDDVKIIYNKLNPEDFIIDNFTSKLIGPIFSITGVVIIVISVIYIILKS
jgi:hypothetical protein